MGLGGGRGACWLAVMVVVAGCGDTSDQAPAPSGPGSLTADTFNLYLAGSYAKYETERRQPIVDAIAAMQSDVVCLQEAWNQSDKDLIVQGAKPNLPNAVFYKTDLETPVTDATDQNGVIPPAPTQAPCADPAIQAKLQAAFDCLVANCSTVPGSAEGYTTSTSCASSKCATKALALITGTPQEKKCYGCMAAMLPTDKLADMHSMCTTNVHAGLAYQGQNGLILLSKHALSASEMLVLPGTWLRRIAIGTTVNLPGGAQVDAYCIHTTPGWSGLTYPYTGDYGNGATDVKGWQAETQLQVKKLAAWVQTRSGSRKALIMGDFNASPAIPAQMIEGQGDDAYALAIQNWTEGASADYTPACTFCSKQGNPLPNADDRNAWIDHIFLKGFTVADVLSTERTFTDAVVPVPVDADAGSDAGPSKVPLSDHYGLRLKLKYQP